MANLNKKKQNFSNSDSEMENRLANLLTLWIDELITSREYPQIEMRSGNLRVNVNNMKRG